MKAKNKKINGILVRNKVATVVSLLCIVLVGSFFYLKKSNSDDVPNIKHTIPYVDGDDAVIHSNSFYENYLNPKNSSNLKRIVEIYGSKNLEFYNDYYRHGFDPITCNTIPPSKISVRLISTGQVANLQAMAEYSNGSTETIDLRVILNEEGLVIDSITCSAQKGNLQPSN